MIHERELREKIAALINGDVSLAAFERWLGSESWEMFSNSPEVVKLMAAVNLLISERHDRIINEREFHADLVILAGNVIIEMNEVPILKRSATSFPMLIRLHVPTVVRRIPQLAYVALSNTSPVLELALRA